MDNGRVVHKILIQENHNGYVFVSQIKLHYFQVSVKTNQMALCHVKEDVFSSS